MLGPITTGIDSTELAQEEHELLKHPLVNGVILFSRNYQSPSQLTELCRKIKTVNENVHAVLVDLDDEKTELLVALSVLEDKNKYKIIKILFFIN